MSLRRDLSLLLLPVLSGLAAGQGDPAVIQRIIDEGKNNSHVWETLEYLSHEIGPRLTGSTSLTRANAWTRDEFRRLGLVNCELEKWGDIPVGFDRGPCYAKMTAPEEHDFQFTARSWTAGTDGPVAGQVVRMPKTEEEYEAAKDSLEGAWVLSTSSGRRRRNESDEKRAEREAAEAIRELVSGAGIAGTITGSRNDLVITGGSWRTRDAEGEQVDLSMDNLPTDISIQIIRSDFEKLEELLDAGESVEVEVDLQHTFVEGPIPVYNTVAEIRGTEKPDEVIILSAHLDSWDGPGSQGTQDNGTGTSVMMEAARILKAAGVQPKRTIRFCLWTGEEQGLYGSREYVALRTEEEKAKISACLVDDGGTNYQGGLVCIASMAPMLEEAIAAVVAAFPDYDIANSIQDRMPGGGSSDHASFNRAGIPGFFWIEKGKGGQEDRNYRFIHHTQHDTTRYAVPEYLVQSATSSAVVAYNLAQAETLLPREQPEEEGEGPGEATPVDATFEVVQGGLTGAWTLELSDEEAPDITFTLDLQQAKDGRVRGSMHSRFGDSVVSEGMWDEAAKSAAFSVVGERGSRPMSVKLEGDELTGTMRLRGEMSFRGKRVGLADAPINGAWKVYLPDFEATVDLQLALGEDDVVRGWYRSTSSNSPLYDGKWDAKTKTVTFQYDYPHAGRLPVTATMVEGELKGTIGEGTELVGKKAEG